jgi:hypothetical protein
MKTDEKGFSSTPLLGKSPFMELSSSWAQCFMRMGWGVTEGRGWRREILDQASEEPYYLTWKRICEEPGQEAKWSLTPLFPTDQEKA